MLATLVIFPLEVTRTRMVVDSGAATYRGALDCAVQLARREGPLSFYQVGAWGGLGGGGLVMAWCGGGWKEGVSLLWRFL